LTGLPRGMHLLSHQMFINSLLLSTCMVSKVRQVLLAISIAIIFGFFVFYGIWAFYKAPKFEVYCNTSITSAPVVPLQFNPNSSLSCKECVIQSPTLQCLQCNMQPLGQSTPTESRESCEAAGGSWSGGGCKGPYCSGYCDYQYTCRTAFERDNKVYERNVFIMGMIFGIAAVFISLALTLESVSIGFMAGGIVVLIVAIIRYWNELGDKLRFVMLAIVLAILIWIGYKKLNPKMEEKNSKERHKP
jgi:hypothetical protein